MSHCDRHSSLRLLWLRSFPHGSPELLKHPETTQKQPETTPKATQTPLTHPERTRSDPSDSQIPARQKNVCFSVILALSLLFGQSSLGVDSQCDLLHVVVFPYIQAKG